MSQSNLAIVLNLDDGFIEFHTEDGNVRRLDGKGLGICNDVRPVYDDVSGKAILQIVFMADRVSMMKGGRLSFYGGEEVAS